MSDENALLAAIIAHPEEDTPRLIYADWLEEHGRRERAEFIRVQVAIANLEAEQGTPKFWDALRHKHCGCDGCSVWCRLNHRQRQLVSESAVMGPGAMAVYDGAGQLEFWLVDPDNSDQLRPALRTRPIRGFAGEAECDASDWLAFGDFIRERHPIVRVQFTGLPPITNFETQPENAIPYRVHFKIAGRWVTVFDRSWQAAGPNQSNMEAAAIVEAFRLRWPGVAFELPGQRFLDQLRSYPGAIDDMVDGSAAAIATAFRFPAHIVG